MPSSEQSGIPGYPSLEMPRHMFFRLGFGVWAWRVWLRGTGVWLLADSSMLFTALGVSSLVRGGGFIATEIAS